jgi:hypothetical protein
MARDAHGRQGAETAQRQPTVKGCRDAADGILHLTQWCVLSTPHRQSRSFVYIHEDVVGVYAAAGIIAIVFAMCALPSRFFVVFFRLLLLE